MTYLLDMRMRDMRLDTLRVQSSAVYTDAGEHSVLIVPVRTGDMTRYWVERGNYGGPKKTKGDCGVTFARSNMFFRKTDKED